MKRFSFSLLAVLCIGLSFSSINCRRVFSISCALQTAKKNPLISRIKGERILNEHDGFALLALQSKEYKLSLEGLWALYIIHHEFGYRFLGKDGQSCPLLNVLEKDKKGFLSRFYPEKSDDLVFFAALYITRYYSEPDKHKWFRIETLINQFNELTPEEKREIKSFFGVV